MAEERKFAILTPYSVQRCAETCGIEDLQTEVAEALGEDASYRIREIVNISAQFMKRSRRGRLLAKDVAKALKITNVSPTIGEEYADDPTFELIEEEDIHFVPDEVVNLQEFSEIQITENEANTLSLSSNWLVLDGKMKSEQDEGVEISPVLMDYYNHIVTCILGEDKDLKQESLSDLRKNSKISALIPYFVNFVSNVKAVSHDLEQLSNLLQTVSSIISNSYINLLGYLKPLTGSVLYCVLEPLTASINPINDHWKLRDYGSHILARIVQKYALKNPEIETYIYDSVKNILSDSTRPLCSHYGAFVTMNSLGVSVVKEFLNPHLIEYCQSYLGVIEEDTSDLQLKEDAYKVIGVILRSIEMLSIELIMRKDLIFDANLYAFSSTILSLFGDAVQARLPLNSSSDHCDQIKSNEMSLSSPGVFYGPRFVKLPALPRRTRLVRRSDYFDQSRLKKRKIIISLGGHSQPMDVSDAYSHTQYFNLTIKTANIGKIKCISKRRRALFFHDYLSYVL